MTKAEIKKSIYRRHVKKYINTITKTLSRKCENNKKFTQNIMKSIIALKIKMQFIKKAWYHKLLQ